MKDSKKNLKKDPKYHPLRYSLAPAAVGGMMWGAHNLFDRLYRSKAVAIPARYAKDYPELVKVLKKHHRTLIPIHTVGAVHPEDVAKDRIEAASIARRLFYSHPLRRHTEYLAPTLGTAVGGLIGQQIAKHRDKSKQEQAFAGAVGSVLGAGVGLPLGSLYKAYVLEPKALKYMQKMTGKSEAAAHYIKNAIEWEKHQGSKLWNTVFGYSKPAAYTVRGLPKAEREAGAKLAELSGYLKGYMPKGKHKAADILERVMKTTPKGVGYGPVGLGFTLGLGAGGLAALYAAHKERKAKNAAERSKWQRRRYKLVRYPYEVERKK